MKYDVIIIGGSYAGLSAAMALGRSLRKVLIIDSGKPCNQQTPHSHNFLTQDGETPAAIAQKAMEQVLKYQTITFLQGIAVNAHKIESGFEISIETGEIFSTSKLILATGITDLLPDIPGLVDSWGISVVHCPYCHGYEIRGKKTGILANGERAFHLASLVNNLTKDITIFTSGRADFKAEQLSKLASHRINIVEEEIDTILHDKGQVTAIKLKNGNKTDLEALYVAAPFVQSSTIPESLGCELTEQGYIKIDPMFKTTIPNVYACGDNSNMMRSVANAVYSGNFVGAIVNKTFVEERF